MLDPWGAWAPCGVHITASANSSGREADSAAHSPNERYSLDHYCRGIEMLIRFIYALPS